MLDLAIIGSGPAAFSAAIYVARAGFSVKIFEKAAIGGAINEIVKLENYPGFVGTGAELAQNFKSQAKKWGVEIEYEEITSLDDIKARAILVATGSEPRPLDFEVNVPVSYCALCDAPLYKGKNIAVVGGGNSAVSEAIYLAGLVGSLTLFSHSKLKAEACLVKQLSALKNVTIHENIEINAAKLDDFAAVFVFIGKRPATSFLPKEILDQDGYIKTKGHATTISGLFAAGDVRSGSIKQAIVAAGDGAAAAIEIIDFLREM